MIASEDIYAVVEMVVKEMTNVSVEPSDSHPRPEDLSGYEVEISGTFNGSVTVELGSDSARALASSMLSIELEETSDDDMHEVMSELTNMVGGNIKSLLPGPSVLSIPERLFPPSAGADLTPRDSRTIVVTCSDRPAWITLNQS